MNYREFKIGKGNKVQIWKIAQDGESFTTEHGQENGKMQVFSDTPGDKGKPDTKGYVSAVDNAKFHVEREIRKKTEHGYIEYVDGRPVSEQITEIDFKKFLPKNFCSYKPQTSIDEKALEKLHKTGKAFYTRKLDGQCHIAVHHEFGWEIYTRRMDLASEKYVKQIEELNNSDYGIGTILVGEMVCLTSDGKEDFKHISRYCRSLPEEAAKLIENKEVAHPVFVIFDILFYNGKDLSEVSYKDRSLLYANFYKLSRQDGSKFLRRVDWHDVTPDNWEDYAKERNWEGFVVVDVSAKPGKKFFSFDGDAKRPAGSWKLKPTYTEDVVVYAAVKGSGKRLDTVGAVFTKQRHPETKEWMLTGKCGSGFTEKDLAEIEALCIKNNVPILEKDKEAEKLDPNREDGLIVIEMEYGERQPGTNKFRFPVFMRVRDDKAVKECFAQKLAPEEE